MTPEGFNPFFIGPFYFCPMNIFIYDSKDRMIGMIDLETKKPEARGYGWINNIRNNLTLEQIEHIFNLHEMRFYGCFESERDYSPKEIIECLNKLYGR